MTHRYFLKAEAPTHSGGMPYTGEPSTKAAAIAWARQWSATLRRSGHICTLTDRKTGKVVPL